MTRKTKKTFFVSVEGESEILYLAHIQNLINNGDFPYLIKIISKKEKPTSFAKAKYIGYSEFPFFHLCDYEGDSEQDIKIFKGVLDNLALAKKIVKVGYNLGLTNICFELWLILHKQDCSQTISVKTNYLDILNKAYKTNFKSWKEMKKHENMLKIINAIELKDVLSAIERAKKITSKNNKLFTEQEYKKYKYFRENPSLSIHSFIELIFKECRVA